MSGKFGRKTKIVKKYEGLFILNLAGKEEGLNDVVDRLQADLVAAGGKVEAVQKMEKKPFVRVTDRKVTGGHYVNFIFEATPAIVATLGDKYRHAGEVHRAFFSVAPKPADKKD